MLPDIQAVPSGCICGSGAVILLHVCSYVFLMVAYTDRMIVMVITELFLIRPIFQYVALCSLW